MPNRKDNPTMKNITSAKHEHRYGSWCKKIKKNRENNMSELYCQDSLSLFFMQIMFQMSQKSLLMRIFVIISRIKVLNDYDVTEDDEYVEDSVNNEEEPDQNQLNEEYFNFEVDDLDSDPSEI